MSNLPGLAEWDPLSPAEVRRLFTAYPSDWRIAGGWAIDLFAGEPHRPHADIDVEFNRADLPLLHDSLPGWLLYAAHGDLTLWEAGTPFPDQVHNLWCRRPGRSWELQLMAVEQTANEWVFRRDHRIRGPLADRTLELAGLPVVVPEIQLLYKSRQPTLTKDERDFRHALPVMDVLKRTRLASWLRLLYGSHPWLAEIDSANEAQG